MQIKNHLRLSVLILIIFAVIIVWYAIFRENRDYLTVAFLDVGQGDAIFIESPDGKQVLIDGGKNNQVLRQLSKQMPFYDRSIDMVVMTHPDADHVGGLPAILENFQVDFVMESGVTSDTGVYREFENLIEEKEIQKIIAQQGQKIPLCNQQKKQTDLKPSSLIPYSCSVWLEVLFPVGNAVEMESNTASIVLKLVHGENSFLLTGDSPKSIEKYLVESLGDYLDVDVLKLGHHGSKTSSSDLLLGFTSPDIAIVSAGLDNRYGHPHKEVTGLLEQFEIDLLGTYDLGNIIFESDGQGLKVEK